MQPFRALVIDDSRVMRTMVMKALAASRLGQFEFTEAADGADALAKFDPAKIDICFVDWNMPNMTGLEFVRHARARGDCAHTPMVMVTSEQSIGKIDEALSSAGADTYVCKPFTPEVFQVKLEKLINRLESARAGAPAPAGGGFFSGLFS
ncbi:MAG TPA: response regulator [Urbifossiella sp.]|jgi:two-component system chemotaxis response regulator CheY|nr:response regulator [Urbifossiella sp.]